MVFWLPRPVHLDRVQLSGLEVFPPRMMPSCCISMSKEIRKRIWDLPGNEAIDGQMIPSHDHVDDKFHCCSITNFTQIESWLDHIIHSDGNGLFTEEKWNKSKTQAKETPFPWCLRKEQLFRIAACHLKCQVPDNHKSSFHSTMLQNTGKSPVKQK